MKTSRTYRPWTTHDERNLREMFEARTPRTEIARRMGRSVISIDNRIVTMGLRRGECRPWRSAEDAEVRRRFARGDSDVKIAVVLGRTVTAVRIRRQRLRLLRCRTYSADLVAQIGLLAADGVRGSEIAAMLGIPRGSVYHFVRAARA